MNIQTISQVALVHRAAYEYKHALIYYYHDCILPSECFKDLFPKLGPQLLHQEYVPRDIYWQILQSADVVVSTAKHEFYGVAM